MAKKLTSDDLERYRRLLAGISRTIVDDLGSLEADAFSANARRPSIDNPADNGSDSFAQEFSLELLQRDESTLHEVQAALERLTADTFGRCEACEHWIPRTRLDEVPYARRCVACQRSLETAG